MIEDVEQAFEQDAAFSITFLTDVDIYPVSDISAGPWLPSTGSDLFATIDEPDTPNDADYDYTRTPGEMVVQLDLAEDPEVNSGHVLTYRLKGNGSLAIKVTIKCGGVTIASWVETSVPASETTYSRTLTAAETDEIDDYSDLRVHIEALAENVEYEGPIDLMRPSGGVTVVAYGTRALSAAWLGKPLFRLQHSATGSQRTFIADPVTGAVSNSEIEEWLDNGGALGYLVHWYDQSGKGSDFVCASFTVCQIGGHTGTRPPDFTTPTGPNTFTPGASTPNINFDAGAISILAVCFNSGGGHPVQVNIADSDHHIRLTSGWDGEREPQTYIDSGAGGPSSYAIWTSPGKEPSYAKHLRAMGVSEDGSLITAHVDGVTYTQELVEGVVTPPPAMVNAQVTLDLGGIPMSYSEIIIVTGTDDSSAAWQNIIDYHDLYVGPLDLSNAQGKYAAAAYGVRALGSDVVLGAQNIIRLRRDSDDQEEDFDVPDGSGNMDFAAIESFLSGANGYVVTWYDQSGNGLDAVQSTPANQPQFFAESDLGRPSLLFDGDQQLNTLDPVSLPDGEYTVSAIIRKEPTNYGAIAGIDMNVYTTQAWQVGFVSGVNKPVLEAFSDPNSAGGQATSSALFDDNRWCIYEAKWSFGSWSLKHNGESLTKGTDYDSGGTPGAISGLLAVGGGDAASSIGMFRGDIAELIIYSGTLP